jgi:hypothetical protein
MSASTPAVEGLVASRSARETRRFRWAPVPPGQARARRWLAGILAAGAVLRLLFMVAWQPAFMGWPDAKTYLLAAHGHVFASVLRPAGYPIFLRALDAVSPGFSTIILVNHALGLATAALIYAAVVRAGGPAVLGLVPAAVVALGGDGVFLEHSPLSESLFIFLVTLGVYAAVRTAGPGRLGWPALAGAALALSATVRVVGVALLPVVGLWMLFAAHGAIRRRLLATGAAALAALSVIGVYYAGEHHATGTTGLSRAGAWHLYGRVAPFADCSRFTPPPGTQVLCETTSRSRRPFVDDYIFNWWYSPAIRNFGGPYRASPAATAAIQAFAVEVIRHQTFDYLSEVGAGVLRYIAPDSLRGTGGGPSYRDFINNILNGPIGEDGLRTIKHEYGWQPKDFRVQEEVLSGLRTWEALTCLQGPVMAVLMLLSLAAPWVTRGRARRVAWLLTLSAWTLLVVPVATLEFSARTAVPGFGALAGAAALGGWGSAAAVRRRGAPAPPAPVSRLASGG